MIRFIKYIIITVGLLLWAFSLYAGDEFEEMKSTLPELLSVNNAGMDYWFTVPPCMQHSPTPSEKNRVRIYVTSAKKTLVTVKSVNRTQNKYVYPHKVVKFELKAEEAQPYLKSGSAPEVEETIYPGKGVHVFADEQLIVYVIVDFYTTSDGFLAIPVSSLGNNYRVTSYGDGSKNFVTAPSLSGIVAAYDNTTVEFTLHGDKDNTTAGGVEPGDTIKAVLNKGDVWMISSGAKAADLSGSRISADKPVAVVSGNQCANIPLFNETCDYIVEMDIPTYTWEKDYHVFTIPGRKYSSIIRIYSSEPNTKIYRDWDMVKKLDEPGFHETRVTPDSVPGNAVFHADKPILVSLYNTSESEDGPPRPNKAPFQMTLSPAQQYQNEYSFSIPEDNGEPIFPNNTIVIICELDEDSLIKEDLEIAKVVDGPLAWKKVRYEYPDAEVTDFQYNVDGQQYAAASINFTKRGVYRLRAENPFGLYLYGFSKYDSYGLPAGLRLVNVQSEDSLPPIPNWTMHCDGTVKGTVKDTAQSGIEPAGFARFYESNVINYSSVRKNSNSELINWSINVIDPSKDAYMDIDFIDKAGNKTTKTFYYSALKLDIKPKIHDFRLLRKNETASKTFTIINNSETGTVKINRLEMKSGEEGFTIEGPDLPFELDPLSQQDVTVHFSSDKDGIYSDSLGIGDSCVFFCGAKVRAEVGGPKINVTDINFGDVTRGSDFVDTIKISNTGITDLHITNVKGPQQTNVFDLTLPKVISPSDPLIIKPGQEPVKLEIRFSPNAETTFSDSIVFMNNASQIDSIAYLNGRGIKPGIMANSIDFDRKRIYRSEFPAGPYKGYIKIENNGQNAVKVNGYEIIDEINGEAFSIDSSDFLDLTIPVGQTIKIPVDFLPVRTGLHRLKLKYINDVGSNTETTIRGIGVVPKLQTENVDFDTTVVDDAQSVNHRIVRFRNVSRENWVYADTLRIYDFSSINGQNTISSDWNVFGIEGFKYNGDKLDSVIVLLPGEFVDLEAAFHARDVGVFDNGLETVSDALNEVTSKWSGVGIAQGIVGYPDTSRICFGTLDTLECEIRNYGTKKVNIAPLRLEPVSSNFYFADPATANGFELDSNESKIIKIGFNGKANTPGIKKALLLAQSSDNYSISDTIEILGEAVQFERYISVSPARQEIEIKDIAEVEIFLDEGPDINMAGIDEFNINVNYDNSFLRFLPNKLEYGNLIDGNFFMPDQPEIRENKGELKFNLVSINDDILNANGALLKLKFDTYLPPGSTDISPIEVDMNRLGNQCVVFKSRDGIIKIRPTCAYDLRKVIYTGEEYYLNNINPNPVTDNTAEIEFSIGLKGQTDIALYDNTGQRVVNIVSSSLEAGRYIIPLNTTELHSGVYWLRMISGDFTKTKKVFIVK